MLSVHLCRGESRAFRTRMILSSVARSVPFANYIEIFQQIHSCRYHAARLVDFLATVSLAFGKRKDDSIYRCYR